MEDKIKYYEKLASETKKLSIKEYSYLLANKNRENKNHFIEKFIPYIYKYSLYVYESNKELFNAYYDFEDLFSDGVLLTDKLYDYFKNVPSHIPFPVFENFFRLQLNKMIAKTYFIKVNSRTINKVKVVLKVMKDFNEEYGYNPSIEEIHKITGYNPIIIKRIFDITSFDDYNFDSYDMEDVMLNDVIIDNVSLIIEEKLNTLSDKKRKIINEIFSFNEDRISNESYAEVGRKFILSREYIRQVCNEFFKKMLKDKENIKTYLKEL